MPTKQQEELAALLLAAGVTAHAISDIISRGRLTRAETGIAIKFFKKALPFMGRVAMSETRGLIGTAARGIPRAAAYVARRNPYALAAALLYAGYIKRDELAELGAAIADDPRVEAAYEELLERGQTGGQFIAERLPPVPLPGIRPLAQPRFKRKVSKANKAVKRAMQILKKGGRKATGAKPGTLPRKAFIAATRAAGLANPRTMSKPGKAATVVNNLARKLIKWWKK